MVQTNAASKILILKKAIVSYVRKETIKESIFHILLLIPLVVIMGGDNFHIWFTIFFIIFALVVFSIWSRWIKNL